MTVGSDVNAPAGGAMGARAWRIAGALALTVALVMMGTPLLGQEAPTVEFPSETTLVTVDVVVADDDGNPVEGLMPDDFAVTEDGVAQTLASFEAFQAAPLTPATAATQAPPAVSTNVAPGRSPGRAFAIVFDAAHLTPGGAERAKPAITRFLREEVHDGDVVTLVSTAGRAWWTATGPHGRDRMIDQLESLAGGRIDDLPVGVSISDYEAKRVVENHDPMVATAIYKRLIKAGAILSPRSAGGASLVDGSAQDATLRDWHTYHPEAENYARALYEIVQRRRRATLDTLERVLESLAIQRGRKSLLLVSEGFVGDSNTPGMRAVIERARHANTAVYFLDARGLVASGGDPALLMTGEMKVTGEDSLETAFLTHTELDFDAESEAADQIAEDTGGFSVKRTNDLAPSFERIARESASYYLLGYDPTDEARDGSYRKIRVKVGRENVRVRARKGYFAPKPGDTDDRAAAADDDGEGTALAQLQRGVDTPFELDAIPLRVSSYAVEPARADEGKVTIIIATEVDICGLAFEEATDRFVDRLSFLVVIRALDHADDEPVSSHEKIDMRLRAETRAAYERAWYPILRDFHLVPGVHEIKVVVLDENGRRMGSVRHELVVPEPTSWWISSPILSDALDRSQGGAPRPVPLARRTFAPQGRLFCQLSVWGAAPDETTGQPEVLGGFVLRAPDGQVVVRGDEAIIAPSPSGHVTRLIGIPLDGLASGSYDLVLTFHDTIADRTTTRIEPFTIAGSDP